MKGEGRDDSDGVTASRPWLGDENRDAATLVWRHSWQAWTSDQVHRFFESLCSSLR